MNPVRKAGDLAPGGHVDDRIWGALSDPNRRQILDYLRKSALTTGQLAQYFDSTRFAVMKHLKVLHEAGLIVIERRGRERLNHLNPLPLQAVCRRWIQPFEKLPADRLLRIKQLAEQRPKA
jgi:DNA-binding transcriptional ArsR family regulator